MESDRIESERIKTNGIEAKRIEWNLIEADRIVLERSELNLCCGIWSLFVVLEQLLV